MIWREKRVLLIVLGLLLAANTLFFFTYRVQYETRLQDLEDRRNQTEAQLVQARSARMTAQSRVAAYRQIQHDVQQIYGEHWSTESERLTTFIAEVKRLAVASELIPASVTFARNEKDLKSGTGSESVTVTFAVQGNYQQVRRLINLLELSQQFVIIDQIGVSSQDDKGMLTLSLQLKTLFRDTSSPASRES